MELAEREARRTARLAAYEKLISDRPRLFDNPPGATCEILFERSDQEYVADLWAELARTYDVPEDYADVGVVYQDPYLTLIKDAVRFPDGRRGAYVRVCSSRTGVGAAVFPVLDDGRVVLIRHFRHSDRRWHWEIPRGFGEPGAGGADTARRELQEELGCRPRELIRLGAMNSDSGVSAGEDQIYFAYLDGATFDDTLSADAIAEGIDEVRPVDPETFRMMLVNGEIADSYTMTAYALATARGLFPAR